MLASLLNVPGIVLALAVSLMAYGLYDLYLGGHYACPRCGARGPNDHTEECPWHR